MKKFAELFENYIDIKKLPSSVNNSIITKTSINANERTMHIYAECNVLINREDIFLAEKLIRESVLALYNCYFTPHYDSSLFNTDYYVQLVYELKRRNASLNGTLNDSSAEIEDKNIIIELNHGGMDFLINQKFDKNLIWNQRRSWCIASLYCCHGGYVLVRNG